MSAADIETALCVALLEEMALYERALPLSAAVPLLIQHGEDATETAGQVQDLLNEVARIESRVAASRRLWVEAGVQPGAELNSISQRVAGLISQIQENLQQAEKAGLARRVILEPQIDTLVRAMRMRKAYGGRSSSPPATGLAWDGAP